MLDLLSIGNLFELDPLIVGQIKHNGLVSRSHHLATVNEANLINKQSFSWFNNPIITFNRTAVRNTEIIESRIGLLSISDDYL